MGYFLEELDDEKFQKLCQAIVVTINPDAICLPVGQPDGGRDAYGFETAGDSKRELVIYQVKFTRDPNSKTERDLIAEVAKTEASKINKLKKKGAKKYYLFTNVRGTSHLDSGSIDRLDKDLSEKVSIPSYCFWRDDIEARINAHSDIKWSFPEISKGSDLLQILLEGANAPAVARSTAIRSYIAAQFSDDEKVKFKQVGLHNDLLELFVDLPARARHSRVSRPPNWLERELSRGDYYEHFQGSILHRPAQPLAATALLQHPIEGISTRIVMEGAPGQGKSTITQYICQVNRIRFLNHSAISLLPPAHLTGPIRLPFRVDLRDYATWLQNKNPFLAEAPALSPGSQPALESFLAAQVVSNSGGQDFNTSDLIAITKQSHVLIVLDGFDEVADISIRKRVVDEISKASVRINANARSVQFIVTSRPSAFTNSPGFLEPDWQHIELGSMALPQITDYANKWMSARELPSRERRGFENVLREKLNQPHMRDLARNPMQLTILLALIHQRGLSLPDKRTALYDSYMDLFFSREAEKSGVVRDHRDLLIDVHQYLAWKLQASAERGKSSGSITDADLRTLLLAHLSAEGHTTNLVDDLFSGMVERVVALVSRVEGTYEFEVQPLREYFAARYLYETAPYSPPGSERRGTAPERFTALSRNFYWLNVTRFFSGCFSKGELAALADCLEELSTSGDMALLQHPRLLSLMMLGDWVFSQQPIAVQRVMALFFQQPGFKIYTSSDTRPDTTAQMSLPDKCGRLHLLTHCYEGILQSVNRENAESYANFIVANSGISDRFQRWLGMRADTDEDRWLALGDQLQLFGELSVQDLIHLHEELGDKILFYLVSRGRFDLIYSDRTAYRRVMGQLKSGALRSSRSNEATLLGKIISYIEPSFYQAFFSSGASSYYAADKFGRLKASSVATPPGLDDIREDIEALQFAVSEIESLLNPRDRDWISSLSPWERLESTLLPILGNSWALAKIALLAAGIHAPGEPGEWTADAWTIGKGLARRIRFARLKSGNISWWRTQLKFIEARSAEYRMMALTTALIWLTPRTIFGLASELSGLADSLDEPQWNIILSSVSDVVAGLDDSRRSDTSADYLAAGALSERVALGMTLRSNSRVRSQILRKFFSDYAGSDLEILKFISSASMSELFSDDADWGKALQAIRYAYLMGVVPTISWFSPGTMKIDIARKICADAPNYPSVLVRSAHTVITSQVGQKARRISDTAEKEGWFSVSHAGVSPQ